METSVIKVKLKGHARIENLEKDIRKRIIAAVKLQVHDITEYKYDTEFTRMICNLIEKELIEKGTGIKKDRLCIEIIKELMNLPVAQFDEKLIIKNIQYIFHNGDIKKNKFVWNIFKSVGQWAVKKLL